MTDIAFETQRVSYFGRDLVVLKDAKYEKFFRKLASGVWEPDTFDFLKRHLDSETILIDVGAWIGITPMWSSFIAKQVIAVEPEPFCCAVIKRCVRDNAIANVTLVEGALSASKQVELFTMGGYGSSISSLIPDGKSDKVLVKGVSIDDLMARAGSGRRVVKIDIEGFEYAFAGELCKLAGSQTRAMQIALHPAAVERSCGWPAPFSRVIAAWKTVALARQFARAFGQPVVRGYGSLSSYIILGVLLRRKAKGTELDFSAATQQEKTGAA
jgi:FkbM family methyltransferase